MNPSRHKSLDGFISLADKLVKTRTFCLSQQPTFLDEADVSNKSTLIWNWTDHHCNLCEVSQGRLFCHLKCQLLPVFSLTWQRWRSLRGNSGTLGSQSLRHFCTSGAPRRRCDWHFPETTWTNTHTGYNDVNHTHTHLQSVSHNLL